MSQTSRTLNSLTDEDTVMDALSAVLSFAIVSYAVIIGMRVYYATGSFIWGGVIAIAITWILAPGIGYFIKESIESLCHNRRQR